MDEIHVRNSNEFYSRIAQVLIGNRTASFQRILNATVEELKQSETRHGRCRFKDLEIQDIHFRDRSNDLKIGNAFGRMIAFGRFAPGTNAGKVKVYREIKGATSRYYVTQDKLTTTVNSIDGIKNDFVKGIILGYSSQFPELEIGQNAGYESFHYQDLKAMDFKKEMMGETYFEANKDILQGISATIDEIDSNIEAARYTLMLGSFVFAGYGNAVFAHTMYSHEDKLNPGIADYLEEVKKRVLLEIRNHVKNASWMSELHREKIMSYLNHSKIVIGVEKKYRNLTLLEEMMDAYDKAFAKVRPGEECELEMLTRAHGLTRHRLIHSQKGSVMTWSTSSQSEGSIAQYVTYKKKLSASLNIQLYPGYIQMLNMYNLPIGFEYGYVGSVIASGILNFLGITDEKTSHIDHLRLARFTKEFQDESQCYVDFYGSTQFCMNNGDCPAGEYKADEGFADVEGSRIAFLALQNALKGQLARRSIRPPRVFEEDVLISDAAERYSEEQWFFIGQQFSDCGGYFDEKHYMNEDPRPRPQIRMNAVAQQMASFTKAFSCKDTQRNYLTEKQCGLYTPKDSDLRRKSKDVTTTQSVDIFESTSQAAPEVVTSSWKVYMCLWFCLMIVRVF